MSSPMTYPKSAICRLVPSAVVVGHVRGCLLTSLLTTLVMDLAASLIHAIESQVSGSRLHGLNEHCY